VIFEFNSTETVPAYEVKRRALQIFAEAGEPMQEVTYAALQAENKRLQAEVASLRLTLGGKTFSADVPEPIGCPAPGACAQVAEIGRLRRGWLRAIQQENSCETTGQPCGAKRCACVEERELLAND
jgi:hypothetical protein